MLDVRRMRVLREVAAKGSFSAAADSLSFTQSAISQQIAALEREVGPVLVERNARGVRLTDAGQALVRHADAVLARLAEAEAELEAIAGLRGGRLRMSAFESGGATIMPPAIAQFRGRHPGVELSLTLDEPEDSVAKLKAGELDLALVFEPGVTKARGDDGIERVPVMDDPMYLVLPPEHPLADRRQIKLSDLAADAWIQGAPTCECNRLLSIACVGAGFEPRIAFESDDYTAVQGFVAAGVGVALIPQLGLTTIRDDIVVRSLGREAPVRRVSAATLVGGYRSPATQAMVDILVDVGARQSKRPELALVS
jgi:DNA-binding transcriptional LysR family regulator